MWRQAVGVLADVGKLGAIAEIRIERGRDADIGDFGVGVAKGSQDGQIGGRMDRQFQFKTLDFRFRGVQRARVERVFDGVDLRLIVLIKACVERQVRAQSALECIRLQPDFEHIHRFGSRANRWRRA